MGGQHQQTRSDLWPCVLSMLAVSAPVAMAWTWFLLSSRI